MLSLVFVVVLEAELLDLCLAVRTLLPTYLRTLVAADVNILGREELAYFSEHVLQELHCLFLSYTENVVCNAPQAPYFIWTACTSEFRICCKSCKHVAREVDLRNYSDALCCSIFENFLYLLLSEVAAFAVRCVVKLVALEDVADDGLVSDGSHLCKTRIFLDFKSPALVVGEMPVESVELVDLHDVEVSLHFVKVEEVT